MSQLTLPNCKVVIIPDDFTEQDKENYLLKLQQDEQYQEGEDGEEEWNECVEVKYEEET